MGMYLLEAAGQSFEVCWVWEPHKLMRIKAMVRIIETLLDSAEPTGSSEPNHYPVFTLYQHKENQMHLLLSFDFR